MEEFHEYIDEYRKQLGKGEINRAYKGLMEYIMDLKTQIKKQYPDFFVSSCIYYSYMDMTYFSIISKSLKQRNLKIALVFLHEAFRFEVWLAGANKLVQQKYWKLFKDSGWNKYQLVPTTKGVDSIVEHILVDNPDFIDLEALTKKIETTSMTFIKDIESFISMH
jgi:hypothetical protein